eukprot:830089_1
MGAKKRKENTPCRQSSLQNRDNKHIQSWLRFNRLLENIEDDTLLRQCILDISEIFDSPKSFIFSLSQAANKEQLQSFFTIVKQKKLESDRKRNNNSSNDTNDAEDCVMSDADETENAPNPRHFANVIPDPIVGNICSYLSRCDIRIFKTSSRQIAIQCLKHKQRIPIRMFDTEQLSNGRHLSDYYPFTTTVHRYPATHEITLHSDRLIAVNPIREGRIEIMNLNGSFTVCNLYNQLYRLSNHKMFILISKSKVSILGDTVREFNSEVHLSDLSKYQLLIVEYFDIFTTNTCIGAFILYKGQIRVSDVVQYIEHKFVYLKGMDNQWHMQSMAYAMDPNHDRFVVYQHRHMHRRGRSELIIPNDERVITSNSITLQLNDKHPSFRNHQFRLKNVFLNAKQVCIDGLTQFAKYNMFLFAIMSNVHIQ